MSVVKQSLMLHLTTLIALCLSLSRSQESDLLPYTYPASPVPNTKSLYFGLLQSFGGEYNGSGSIPGVQLALDNINNDQVLLPGYTLHYILRDSQCERTTALESLHRLLFEDPVKIAIMGSGCSPATEPTAEIDHFYNLTHISCVSSSIALSDRNRYRAYYQMLPSEIDIAAAVFGTIQYYGWGHIAIITQNEQLFTLTTADLIENLQATNVTYTERTFESEIGIITLQQNGDLFDSNARIFFISSYSSHARDIICQAYRAGYSYPQYMFLTYAWYSRQWWTLNGSKEFNCTGDERQEVLKHTLAFLHFPFVRFGNVDEPTDVQLTGSDYMEEVMNHVGQPPLYLGFIEGSSFCYDATWTLAKALNRTMSELMENEAFNQEASLASGFNSTDFSLSNFTYMNNVIQTMMLEQLSQTDFTGVTGEVKFKNGIRDVEALRVLQIQHNTSTEDMYVWVKIGKVVVDDSNVFFSYVNGFTNGSVFRDGVPYDGIPLEEDVSIHPALTSIIAILVAIGLGFSIVCLIFNIVFRKRKLIRLSSPNLNYIICVGAILLYLDMLLLVIPSTDRTVVSVHCNLVPWFTSVGYSLCYGTILVKMFRVYYIYSNPSPRKKNTKIIKDEFLILIIFCMVAIDLIALLTYTGVQGYNNELEAKRVRNAEDMQNIEGVREITTNLYTFVCDSKGRKIFLGLLYGYKSLLQILSLFLAFATRRVKVKGLNDTKAVAAAVYVTSITFTALFVSTYSVIKYINVYAAIFCMALFIGTSTILALLYIPKMVFLYKDPEGLTVFREDTAAVTSRTTSDQSTIETLRRRIRELETTISQNKSRPESAMSSQHLVAPHHSHRLSNGSNISLEDKEHKTIWDTKEVDNNGTTTKESSPL